MKKKRSYRIFNVRLNPSLEGKFTLEQGYILRDAALDLSTASDRSAPIAEAYARGLSKMVSTICSGVVRFTFYRDDSHTQVEIFIGSAWYYTVEAERITEVEQ